MTASGWLESSKGRDQVRTFCNPAAAPPQGGSESWITYAALCMKGCSLQEARFARFPVLGLGIHLPSSDHSKIAVLTRRCAVLFQQRILGRLCESHTHSC